MKNVKQKIEKTEGIPFTCQSFSYLGSELEDHTKLSDYEIGHKSTINLKVESIELNIRLEDGQDIDVEVMITLILI